MAGPVLRGADVSAQDLLVGRLDQLRCTPAPFRAIRGASEAKPRRLVSASNDTFAAGAPGGFGRGHGENAVELGEHANGDGAVSPRPFIIMLIASSSPSG